MKWDKNLIQWPYDWMKRNFFTKNNKREKVKYFTTKNDEQFLGQRNCHSDTVCCILIKKIKIQDFR